MSVFVGRFQKLVADVGPWFLHNRNVAKFLETMAFMFDAAETTLYLGMRQSLPLRCDSSALPTIAYDRSMRIYPTEPVMSSRVRLSQWLPLHRQRGTHLGELNHSRPYFYPNTPIMRIVHQDGAGASATWHTLNEDGSYSIHRATPSNWNYDGNARRWCRFWVILYPPAGMLTLGHYDETGVTYGGAYSGGSIASSHKWNGLETGPARDMIDMVQEWARRRETMWSYIIATDPNSFDPTATAVTSSFGWTSLPVGNWGSPIAPITGIRTRPHHALWLFDRGQG
jgi:hypothetical protein